jgi:hypothetical protein
MPSSDHTVELKDLLLEPSQMSPECQETRTGYLRNSLVSGIGNDLEQLLYTIAAERRYNPKLGKMGRIALITAVC